MTAQSRLFLQRLLCLAIVARVFAPAPSLAQVASTASPPPADTPAIKVGVLVFADYTVQQQPRIQDADGNTVTLSAFQIARSYINVTGNITRAIAFRVTPDVVRETGVGSALNGSYTFRLKYAFAQWNFDRHITKGSFARFGLQATPWVEFIDAVYRYRFQGQTFEDREGFLPSADLGASFRYNLPGSYGDMQAAIFNGEGYARFEANDQKSVQLRGTVRPLPTHDVLRGLRLTGVWDHDAYVRNDDRRRAIVGVTFEHPHVHAGFNYLATRDQTSAAVTATDGRGWTTFVTPITGHGWEGLLRFDRLEPNTDVSGRRKMRAIAGVAYWFAQQGTVASALLFDVDNVKADGFATPQPTQRKYAVHALVSF